MTQNNPQAEERNAVIQLKCGDLNGMEVLVRRYQVRAVYAAYLIVRDMKLAEDIVQGAFLHAAEKIHQFDESRPFGGWFLRSVVNEAIKTARRQKRFIPLDGNGANPEELEPVFAWLRDPHPGPDQIVETKETCQMVWEAMEQLPAEQRAVIVMRHFLEMSEVEIEQVVNRPSTTIRWRLFSARNRLRELLRPLKEDDAPEEKKRQVEP